MADETPKPPSTLPSHAQQPHPGPSPGGEAHSAESFPTPQQLPEAPPRQAQTSIMQDVNAATAPSASKQPQPQPQPPSIPSLQEPTTQQPTTTTDPRFTTMDSNNNNADLRSQDIVMGGAAEQQQQQQPTHTVPPTATGTGTGAGPTPKVRAGGAPARIFLNENIVPYLLEGMKTVTRDQPQNPLRALGEYLIQKSNEVEGAGAAGGEGPGAGVNIKTETK